MIFIQKYYASVFKSLILAVLALVVLACGDDKSEDSIPAENEVYWNISSTVSSSSGSSALIINGTPGTNWYASITEGASWCSFKYNDYTGKYTNSEGVVKDGLNVLYVYYSTNNGDDQRAAELKFNFEGEAEQTFDLVQVGKSQNNMPHFDAWAELPAYKENSNYEYVAHYAALNDRTARNYSLCFDKTKKAALWVAYPLHSVYIGSLPRPKPDPWTFDPLIPEAYQANLGLGSYKGNYDRGHQIPNADRTSVREMQYQTFYDSNATPQLDNLNQKMWANLESKVRGYRCSDTLYVVTGAYFGPNAGSTTDKAGNVTPIPTNYFKVLLRSRSGSTGKAVSVLSADELIAIGFWVEQKDYDAIQPPKSICRSVADIERETGFTFFPNLSSSAAASVKKQNNPSQWGIN